MKLALYQQILPWRHTHMYTFENLMEPVWTANTIYDEGLTFVKAEGAAEAPLMFEPEKILSVTNADKTKEYTEGVDYTVCGKVIRLTEDSKIFYFTQEEMIFDTENPGKCFPTRDGRYSLFSEGHFFHDRQIAVTYVKKSGTLSWQPEYAGDSLSQTIAKLKNQEPVKIVLYGDSISAGANSSGVMLTTPFLPTFGALLGEQLRRHYGGPVEVINTAVSGMATGWGIENALVRAGNYKPDLCIIAFGMNDGGERGLNGEQFSKNIARIRSLIKDASPETEFILCATTMPNTTLKGFYGYQDQYYDVLKALECPGTAIASFYHMQKALLEKKRFIDMTGNNVNHPNDFMIRCHAQNLACMLIQTII